MQNPEHDAPQTGPTVSITISGKVYSIHRGSTPVGEIKALGLVPLEYTLVIVDGQDLKELPDDGKVTLKGGEVFVGRPKTGQSA